MRRDSTLSPAHPADSLNYASTRLKSPAPRWLNSLALIAGVFSLFFLLCIALCMWEIGVVYHNSDQGLALVIPILLSGLLSMGSGAVANVCGIVCCYAYRRDWRAIAAISMGSPVFALMACTMVWGFVHRP